jgi:hypothetical protein
MPQSTLEDMFFADRLRLLPRTETGAKAFRGSAQCSAGAAGPGADIDSLDCWDLD